MPLDLLLMCGLSLPIKSWLLGTVVNVLITGAADQAEACGAQCWTAARKTGPMAELENNIQTCDTF